MRKIITLSIFSLFLFQCNKNAAKKDTIVEKETTNKKEVSSKKEDESNKILKRYAWVENLNIRDASNMKAAIIAVVQSTDELLLTGEKSENKEEIVLRSAVYNDYFFEVKTADGKQGWVYGGAIKKENEKKGNAEITPTKFNFENFGEFDLSTWKFMGTKNSEGGDAESIIKTYQHPTQERKMVITNTSVGEYGYDVYYELLGMNDRKIVTRGFNFSNDSKEITVEVITHNIDPKKVAKRSQKVSKSSFQLKPNPTIVIGKWSYEDAEKVD